MQRPSHRSRAAVITGALPCTLAGTTTTATRGEGSMLGTLMTQKREKRGTALALPKSRSMTRITACTNSSMARFSPARVTRPHVMRPQKHRQVQVRHPGATTLLVTTIMLRALARHAQSRNFSPTPSKPATHLRSVLPAAPPAALPQA